MSGFPGKGQVLTVLSSVSHTVSTVTAYLCSKAAILICKVDVAVCEGLALGWSELPAGRGIG